MIRFKESLFAQGSTWTDKVIPQAARLLNLVARKDLVTYKEVLEMEETIATLIFGLLRGFEEKPVEKIEEQIAIFEEKNGCQLHEHQRDAVIGMVNHGFSVMTGGPGTGKTTTVNCAAFVIEQLEGGECTMVAPSGKAAVRMTESTGKPATTVHKRCGLRRDGEKPIETKMVEGKTIFVDECSMLGMETTYWLLKSISSNRRVVFIGDTAQLPSVSPGAVLRDLIASEVVPVFRLTKTFRQAEGSMLLENIKAISRGDENLSEGNDFKLIKALSSREEVEGQVMDEIKKAVERWGVDNVCVLIPYRQNKPGRAIATEGINPLVQAMVNPGEGRFRVGDVAMQLKNRKEVANGEVGKVIEVTDKTISVEYPSPDKGKNVVIYDKDTREVTLAYSMSIHKSQGSEYPCVIMVLLNEHSQLLQRNMLYTGVSRAKKECILISDQEAIAKSVATVAEDMRITGLKNALKKAEFCSKFAT